MTGKFIKQMKVLFTFLIGFIVLSGLTAFVHASTLSDFDWNNSLPPHLVDHTGFYSASDKHSFSTAPILQLTPLIKGQKHYGFKINPKVFGFESRQVSIFEIKKYLQSFVEPITGNSYRLIGLFNGDYYAISSKYSDKISTVRVEKSNCIGLCFDFFTPKTLYIGDVSQWGLSLDFSWSKHDLRSFSGINFGESFNAIPENINNMVDILNQGPEVYQTGFALTNLYSMINTQKLAVQKSAEDQSSKSQNPLNQFEFLINLESKTHSTPINIIKPLHKNDRSDNLNKTMDQLNNNLQEEIKWRETINPKFTRVVAHPPVQKFIQDLCDYLATNFDVPKEVWPECYVSASPAPNAYAYPGGKIFVTAGLIGMLNNLDSLILVVGHEIGHVVARHTSKSIPLYKGFNFALNGISVIHNIWALQGGNKPLDGFSLLDNWYLNSIGSSIYSSIGLEAFMHIPIAGLMYYSRSNEREADELGHEIAYATGAKNKAMAEGWRRFAELHQKLGINESFIEKLKRSHPTPESREEDLKERSSKFEHKLKTYNQTNRLSEEYYTYYSKLHNNYSQTLDEYIEEVQKKSANNNNLAMYYKFNFSRSSMSCLGHIFD